MGNTGEQMERKIELIDTHCHLNHSLLASDLDGILSRSRKAGVTDFIVPGYRYDGWQTILSLCRERAYLHPALGMVLLHRRQNGHENQK